MAAQEIFARVLQKKKKTARIISARK